MPRARRAQRGVASTEYVVLLLLLAVVLIGIVTTYGATVEAEWRNTDDSTGPLDEVASSFSGGGSGGSGGDDSGGSGGGPGGGLPGGPDDDGGAGEDGCGFYFNDSTGRWHDPETGLFVSFDEASAAGCS